MTRRHNLIVVYIYNIYICGGVQVNGGHSNVQVINLEASTII
jgi:hypothetical protein